MQLVVWAKLLGYQELYTAFKNYNSVLDIKKVDCGGLKNASEFSTISEDKLEDFDNSQRQQVSKII